MQILGRSPPARGRHEEDQGDGRLVALDKGRPGPWGWAAIALVTPRKSEAPLPARLIPSARTDPSNITKDFVNHSDLLAKAPSLAAGMAAADHSPDTQLSQTRHRAALVASWHIAPGSPSSSWAAARAT